MKIEYLRHDYKWSSRCITGTKVGWGITASSTPLDKDRLLELEKLAAATVADPQEAVPIETLIYSPTCGFTKMVTLPYHEGEDGRKNKQVHIYQVADMTNTFPECYLTPGDSWDPQVKGDYLDSLFTEPMEMNVETTLISMKCYDHLPEFLRVILRALFEETESVNFVTDWKEKDFVANSRLIMNAIHHLIPDVLCKRASYQSFTRGEVSNVTFYFSRDVVGKNYVHLKHLRNQHIPKDNELERFFYYRLARSYVEKDILYPEFMDKVASYVAAHEHEGDLLKKMQWMFLAMCIKVGEDGLSEKYMISQMPQLFYWCDDDPVMKEAVDIIRTHFHSRSLDAATHVLYENALMVGYTKRSEELIAEEVGKSLHVLFRVRPDLFAKQLNNIKQKNTNIFTRILTTGLEKEDGYPSMMFENNSTDAEIMKTYVFSLNPEVVGTEFINHCMMKCVVFLNSDIFSMEYYKIFDEIIKRLHCQQQGADILRTVEEQFADLRTQLSDDKLEVACYVEKLLNTYDKAGRYVLLANEKAARQIKPAPVLEVVDMGKNSSDKIKEVTDEIIFSPEEVEAARKSMAERKKKQEKAAADAMHKTGQTQDQKPKTVSDDSFLSFFLNTIPMGFITGCVIFMLQYSLKIGHGKIAIGMAGMWVIVQCNYLAYLQIKQRTIRTWQTIGLCLTEGLILAFAGNAFRMIQGHLIFFVAVGLIAIFLSVNNLFQERERRVHKKS